MHRSFHAQARSYLRVHPRHHQVDSIHHSRRPRCCSSVLHRSSRQNHRDRACCHQEQCHRQSHRTHRGSPPTRCHSIHRDYSETRHQHNRRRRLRKPCCH